MEGKDGEVLTEHETPEYFWLGKTVEGTRTFDPNLTIHGICMHLLERIENIENWIKFEEELKRKGYEGEYKRHLKLVARKENGKQYISRRGLRESKLIKVREILLGASSPLHINEILSKLDITTAPLFSHDIDKFERDRLVGILNYYCKQQKIFVKKGRSIYGLIEREK